MKPAMAGAATALIVSAVALLVELYALSPYGFPMSLHPALALIYPVALCVFLFGIACILLVPRPTRRIADAVAAFCLAYAVAGTFAMIATAWPSKYAFPRLATRSTPLVTAIHAFEADHRWPPSSLRELVPTYLPAVPGTGIGAYPHYSYEAGGDGNWRLWVPASEGPFDFTTFEYSPDRREWRQVTD